MLYVKVVVKFDNCVMVPVVISWYGIVVCDILAVGIIVELLPWFVTLGVFDPEGVVIFMYGFVMSDPLLFCIVVAFSPGLCVSSVFLIMFLYI